MKIDSATRLALSLMKKNHLSSWTLVLDMDRYNSGSVSFKKKEIRLSRPFILVYKKKDIKDLIINKLNYEKERIQILKK